MPEEIWDVDKLPDLIEVDLAKNELETLPKTLEKRRNEIFITVDEVKLMNLMR